MPYDSRIINPKTPDSVGAIKLLQAEAETALAGGFYGTPEDSQSASPYLTKYLPKPQQEYSQKEIAKSAWERENEIGSFVASQQSGFKYNNEIDSEDLNFDIVDYIFDEVDNSDYAPYAENFLQFKNRKNAELYKRHLDKEFKNTEILQNSGWSGLAWGIGAGLLSPINFVPVGGSVYKAYKSGKFAKSIALATGIGAGSVSTTEALLQSSQESRTLGESVMNVGAGTILAGVLGGASATLSKQKFNKLAKKVEKDIQLDTAEVRINPETQNFEINPNSVGAASVNRYEPIRKQYDEVYLPELKAKGETPLLFKDYLKQQTALVPTIITDAAKFLKIDKLTNKIKLVNNLNPIQRLTRTEYAVKPREFAEKLMKTGMFTNKNYDGIANYQSAEINKKTTLAKFNHEYKPAENKAYREFKKRVKETGFNPVDQLIKNDTEFYEAVSRAMINQDFSGVPEVDNLAKKARVNVFNNLGQKAIDVGIFQEGILTKAPKTALSYFPRLFNKLKVIAKENDLREFFTSKIKNVLLPQIKSAELSKEKVLNSRILDLQTKKIELENKLKNGKIKKQIKNANKPIDAVLVKTEINLLNKKIERLKNKYIENQVAFRSKFDEIADEDIYVKEIVDDLVSTLKGEDRLGLVNDTNIKINRRGPLKERTLNFIRDEELEPWLEMDSRKVINYYANTLATDIEIARAFDGDLTLSNAIEDISAEYDEVKIKAKTEDEQIKIDKEKRKVVNDLTSVAKIMRGFYNPVNPDNIIVRGGRVAREYNYITKMGQVVIASLSDISRPIAKHGLKTWARYLPELISNLKGIKLSVKDAKLGGNIYDIVAPDRMASFSGLNDKYASQTSTFERYIENVSKFMSKTNMMPIWNDAMKSWSAVLSQQRMIKNIKKYNSLNRQEIAYLAQNGIGKDDIITLQDQLKKYSYKEGGLLIANTEKWDNEVIRRKYYNALNTDIDSIIITMGAGDLPLIGNTEMGKVILQFKSFAFAATQQALISGLQQKDLAVLNGLISGASLGMLIYYFKKKMAGKELSNDPAVWLMEGMDKSGFTGILGEYSHIADKVGLGINSLLNIEQSSRYATRNFSTFLLGPTIGLIDDGAVATRALTSGEITEGDAKAIRRMIFLNNHWLLSGAMDRLQESFINKE
jgi:hypothetical protein